MAHQPFQVCFDVNAVVTDQTFDWKNDGTHPCHIHVVQQGVLTQQDFDVAAGGRTPATVAHAVARGAYDYTCRCGDIGAVGNPKIIISS